jgi:hypothetical protein
MTGGRPDGGGCSTAVDGMICIGVPPAEGTARSAPSHVVILGIIAKHEDASIGRSDLASLAVVGSSLKSR